MKQGDERVYKGKLGEFFTNEQINCLHEMQINMWFFKKKVKLNKVLLNQFIFSSDSAERTADLSFSNYVKITITTWDLILVFLIVLERGGYPKHVVDINMLFSSITVYII